MPNPFSYPSEKFATARRALMLPHPNGEAESISAAFMECSLGMHRLDKSKLSDNAADWIGKLERLMDTSAFTHMPNSRWLAKAESLTFEDKMELRNVVDELSHWFDRRAEEVYAKGAKG